MAVTIVGTLEQIYTSGGDTVSEAVHVNFESPTDVPLPLHESIVFTDRNPPVDIRDALEAHLEDEDAHGFTSVTRVPVSRSGAMAEWTAVRPDSVAAEIVLWEIAPLQQEGVEWGLVAVGNTSIVGSGYRSVEIGEDASSAAEGSIAVGPESSVPDTSPRSVAIGEGAVIPPNTPDRTVLRSKEIWVRPHADADRVDSALILQDTAGNSRTIRATPANSLTVNGVPVGGGSNTAVWGGITGTLANQTDLSAALAGKANTGHNHDGVYAPATHTHAWSAITGKPTTFAPSAHSHGVGDISASGTPGSTTYLRGDGTWFTPPNTNTTYSEITEAEISAGTASTLRTISGRRAQAIVNKARDGVALASSLSLVATSGSYTDLTNRPTLGALAAKDKVAIADIDAIGFASDQNFLRGDGRWGLPDNTTYSVISEAEITAGTSGLPRTMSGQRAKFMIDTARAGLMVADDFLIDTSGPPVGSPVHPVATGDGAIALGDGAIANGANTNAIGTEAEAVGDNSTAIGYQTASFSNSTAIGYQAETTANNANAIGYGAKVDDVQAQAFGRFATVGAGEAFTTEVGGQNLRILRRNPSRDPLAFASTLQLADATGALHTIGADATNGLTYDGTVMKNRANHTGTQPASTISDFQSSVSANTNVAANTSARHTHSNKAVLDAVTAAYTTGEKSKLSGIATGATKNQTDAYLLNRGNHTGNQPIHTITNLQEILDGKPIEIDPGNYATAIGVDAQAPGTSSFAAGHGAEANGTNSVAVGNTAESIAPGSTAIGMASYASGNDATGIGQGARAEGERSVAMGSSALALGDNSTAIGRSSLVPESSPRSQALGYNTHVPENTPDTTIIPAKSLQLIPHSSASTLASDITLYDADGNPHTITHEAAYGQTHSHSENTSPAGENLTGVGTYSTAGVLRSGTLQSFIPAITSGLWDVDIEAHALVYRSVATGGVYLFVGNGTTSYQPALGRLSPQTHAYTLNVNVSPSIVDGTALKAVGPGQVIDMRYTGFQTAGTTYVINHGWKITARRVG